MTMPSEEVRSLSQSRQFLRDLLDPSKTSRVPRAVREQAIHCLHHFPFECHIEQRWADDVCKCGKDREFCKECMECS